MAAPDPGLAQMSAPAEDPTKGMITPSPDSKPTAEGQEHEEERATAPDQFDDKFTTSRGEIWAYYAYYIGNNGLTLFNFAPTAAQNLLYQQAEAVGGADNEILFFAGADRTINSIILLCNGISFAIQIVIFLVLGSYADFGTFRPNILIVLSLVAWGVGFGWLGVHEEGQWRTGLGLYVVGLIAYQLCLTYWTAAFPGLARNTVGMREEARRFERGEIGREEYDFADSMKRNELSNTAFYTQSVGEIVILAVIVGVMFGVDVNASAARNNWGLSVLIAFASGVWILLAIPWFVLEKRRPGQDPGMVWPTQAFAPIHVLTDPTEHRPRRLLAALGRPDADLAAEAKPLLPHRLLPTRRLAQHDRHRHRHAAERDRGVQHAAADVPAHRRHRGAGGGDLVVLEYSEALSTVDEDYV